MIDAVTFWLIVLGLVVWIIILEIKLSDQSRTMSTLIASNNRLVDAVEKADANAKTIGQMFTDMHITVLSMRELIRDRGLLSAKNTETDQCSAGKHD